MAYQYASAASIPPIPARSAGKLAQGHGATASGKKSIPRPPPKQAKATSAFGAASHVQKQQLQFNEQELTQDELENPDLEDPYECATFGYDTNDAPTTRSVTFAPRYHDQETSNPSGAVGIDLQLDDLGGGNVDETEVDGNDNMSSVSSSLPSQAPSVEHFNISFEYKKTFRQHKGAKAFKKYEKCLKKTYSCTLRWTYNILLIGIGLILVIFWGLINAFTAVLQAWCISPLLRVSLVLIKGFLPLILEPCGLCLKTCSTALGINCGGGVPGAGLGRLGGMQSSFKPPSVIQSLQPLGQGLQNI